MRSFVYDYPVTVNNKDIILQKVYLIEDEDITNLNLPDVYGQIPENKQVVAVCVNFEYASSTKYIFQAYINQKDKDRIVIQNFNLSLERCENIFNEFIQENSYNLVIKNCKKLHAIIDKHKALDNHNIFLTSGIYIIDCPNINYTILENTLKSNVCKYRDIYPEFYNKYICCNPSIYINGKKIYNITTIFELENQIEELKSQVSTIPNLLNTILDLSERIKRLEDNKIVDKKYEFF